MDRVKSGRSVTIPILVEVENMSELEFYRSNSPFTDPGKYTHFYGDLPNKIESLCKVIHGVIIHRDYTKKLYKFESTKNQKSEADTRYIEKILAKIIDKDNSLLTKKRSPQKRFFGTCRDFSTLLVSFLRHQGIPSRLRYGFATYFKKGWYEDHVLCEYWNSDKKAWMLVDPELGDAEIKLNNIDFDSTNVPKDKFLVSGMAWKLIREEGVDGNLFGVPPINIKGTWFVFASVLRDLFALNKIELLPWDHTEFTNRRFSSISELPSENNRLIDRISEMTVDVENNFEELVSQLKKTPDLTVIIK